MELIDRASGPAMQVAKALGVVRRSQSEIARAAQRDELGRFLGKSQTKWGQVTKTMKAAGGAAAGILGIMGGAALAAVGVGTGLAVAGAKTALDAASFKRNMLSALGLMLGSSEAAAAVYKDIDALADSTPFEARNVFDAFKALKGSGLDVAGATDTLKGVLDVASFDPKKGPETIERMTHALNKMKAMGKASLDPLQELAMATGGLVGVDKIAAEIAVMKKLGSAQAAMAAISAGQVTSEEARLATLKAIQKFTGKELGGAAEVFGRQSLEGQLSTFKSRIGNLFENIDLGPLIKALDVLNEVLKGPAGQALGETFNAMFAELGGFIREAFTAENIKAFLGTLKTIVQTGYELTKAIGGGAFETFSAVMKPLAEVFQELGGSGDGLKTFFRDLGKIVGFTAAILVYGFLTIGAAIFGLFEAIKAIGKGITGFMSWLGASLRAAGTWIQETVFGVLDWFLWLGESVTGLAADAWNWGWDLVAGMGTGLQAAWDWLVGKLTGLVDLLPDTVKKILGIASPSKVMMKLGVHTVSGFGLGMVKAANDVVPTAAGAMAEAATGGGATEAAATFGGSAPASAPAGGGGARSIVISGPIHVHVGGASSSAEAEQQGRAAAAGFVDELERLWEQVA